MPSATDPSDSPRESDSAQPASFETAMERLEGIVQQMEGARLSLEGLLSCYEEGTRLVKICGEYLNVAEQRVEIITRDSQGQPRMAEFKTAPAADEASSVVAGDPAVEAADSDSPPLKKSLRTPARPHHEVSLF